jgi:hypothetical protein
MKLSFEIESNALKVFCKKSENGNINVQLINKGISVYNLSSTAKTLEEKFLSLTVENKYPKESCI